MLKHTHVGQRFVEFVPDRLEPGILYVSMPYATVTHLCCCGCGSEVVTPLTPTDWQMFYDGEAISLFPSVGNWNLPCRSHYVIRGGRVIEYGPWSEKQIMAGQDRDRRAKTHFYGAEPAPKSAPAEPHVIPPKGKKRFFDWLLGR